MEAVFADGRLVGAGAAGLVAAVFAARRRPLTLIERTKDGGRKILISGGGRCNVLPSALAPSDSSPTRRPTCAGMLRSSPLHEQRAFFEDELQIPLALEEESGKLFPRSNKAKGRSRCARRVRAIQGCRDPVRHD